MRQLVSNHVQGDREAVKHGPVAVAEYHLTAVPESVIELLVVMDGGDERQSVIIDRIALVVLQVEIEGVAKAVISLVYFLITRGALSFRSDERPRLGLRVLGGIDRPMDLRRGRCEHRWRSRGRQQLKGHTLGTHCGVEGEGVQSGVSLGRTAVPGNLAQHVRRHDAEDGMPMGLVAGVQLHWESPVTHSRTEARSFSREENSGIRPLQM